MFTKKVDRLALDDLTVSDLAIEVGAMDYWFEISGIVRMSFLTFLSLPDPETAMARVAERVAQGGHAVPELTIRRRFAAGLRNFSHPYRGLVDMWQHYDNASAPPALIAEGGNP